VDHINLRAVLASAKNRLWRNLDKLLVDAQTSGIVQVSVFFEYLQTLQDVGAREGEAAIDAHGAVQLMTIHKAKGLEFPIVVLADAAHQNTYRKTSALYLPGSGLGFEPDRPEGSPLFYRLIQRLDSQQDKAENYRLLYVALTRAREKTLISGHIGKRQSGWLADLTRVAGLDLAMTDPSSPVTQTYALPGGQTILCTITLVQHSHFLPANQPDAKLAIPNEPHLGSGVPLYQPVFQPENNMNGIAKEHQAEFPDHIGETSSPTLHPLTGERIAHKPAYLVGELVHRALALWCFPGEPRCQRLLETTCFEAGLVDPTRRASAIQTAEKLLLRLRAHPIFEEIETADERYHEVPYLLTSGESGHIDLIYRASSLARANGWRMIDFKTEGFSSQEALDEAIQRNHSQMLSYRQAISRLLDSRTDQPLVSSSLVFLDYEGRILDKKL
jgi:ATP-dependent exoDNAse (exonuclease V) beta subunit